MLFLTVMTMAINEYMCFSVYDSDDNIIDDDIDRYDKKNLK